MNFFQHQDIARQQTRRLVLLFAFAILTITTLLSLSSLLVYLSVSHAPLDWQTAVRLTLLCFVVVSVVIGLSAWLRWYDLRKQGGSSIAESLGGQLIASDTTYPQHRQLLNVVEEMAIASGTPVPQVYLLEHEPGINAFAAGVSIDDAVIGITQGALDHFNRDELQGVIAHEFSHILNGDMHLNTRLVGLLFGITCIAYFGHLVVDNLSRARRRQTRRTSDSDKGVAALFVLGLICIVLGWLGTLFGAMIKAAISRQREYLADASAVQFTRNDQGISSALKKIAAHTQGSTLKAKACDEVSHMMFGQSRKSGLAALFATHPPLKERIRRIEPYWDGHSALPEAGSSMVFTHSSICGIDAGASSPPMETADEIIIPGELYIIGQALIKQLPLLLINMAREPYSARFVAFALIFDGSEVQRTIIKQHIPEASHDKLLPWLDYAIPTHLRLPLLELSVPALKTLSQPQRYQLCEVLRELSLTDHHYSLAEWCVINLLEKQLLPEVNRPRFHKTLHQLQPSVQGLLGELTWVCYTEPEQALGAFEQALSRLGLPVAPLLPAQKNWFRSRDALELLLQAKVKERARFAQTCRWIIESNGRVTVAERELYRVIACFLEVPEPPLNLSE
ncbi:M48 family metalloprotease [Vibrio sp. V27_P1S3P104]|uniref:M48 family metallopeptidase n=1 Tax=unclassified Vibrio TaxID=2614977 RepID=UPI001372A97D|nr:MULTISPECIES: M48 family metallopeptidase [unclassified Vibrio]NAW69738.1 M48 family metalloprotease [Vibrio sp. V28_P6S34P95]NAX06303.1 M48 family metalloprotease [Vibrio sp. V30_P3S12P165]NAX34061.1 M48 family metalloprotease [Vibrio sp. V29_P1S30P107]NAX37920.1 M48 family metalloprotease [Vibrio sp. V27_P1S3P104]NAX39722.1 M48 family metalloprotease [Vibrio sp. V26_P1S5P106]